MIVAEDEETWPREVRKHFEGSLQSVRDYIAFERELDRRYEEEGDFSARHSPPPNPHRADRQLLLERVQGILLPLDLLGYHCTRLTRGEETRIKGRGMLPLSSELVQSRIKDAVLEGELTQPQGEALLKGAYLDESCGSRTGMTWFIFCRNTLRDQWGLNRFFAYWGGEAVYAPQEQNALGEVLESLGAPAIIEASVPISEIQTFRDMSERFLTIFLANRGIEYEHAPEFEGNVRVPLPGSRIERIITPREPLFEELTGYSTWDSP